MISPGQASKLLDEVVFERVMSFIDLPSLCLFQQELEIALIEVGVDYDEVAQVARQMVDDALHRVADDPRVELVGGDSSCELCDAAVTGTAQPARSS